MRKLCIAIVSLSFLFTSCKGEKETKTSRDEQTVEKTTAVENEEKTVPEEKTTASGDAVCVIEPLSVRETPEKKGKWITSIGVGETVTFLGEEATDSVSKRVYYKVKLIDGKVGWTISDFIVVGGKVGAFSTDAYVYKRPDLLTKTDKKYSALDVVAVAETQGEWLKVKGKRSDGTYVEEGWVKSANISGAPVDIAAARFAAKAMAKSTMSERIEALQGVVSNTDLSASKFIPTIEDKIKDYSEKNKLKEVIQKEAPKADEEVSE